MRRVLVVDDSLTVRMDLVDGFEERGVPVHAVGSLAAARDAMAGEVFAALVLDVVLPDGDGIGFLRELRARPATAKLPVLLLSSEQEVAHRVRGLVIGADAFVGKPYDRDAVVARVAALVARAPTLPVVLVVDDSPSFRAALREVLLAADYDVVEASSGEEGLRIATATRPYAVLVDGVMPGMDGATLVRRLRLDPALRTVPCLLLTASDAPGAELAALDAGADAFVRKDGDLELVLARLHAVLRTASTAAALVPVAAGPIRVLAVDDSRTWLEHLRGVLPRYALTGVLSGEAAIEALAESGYDCVLLDRTMPGMGGEEACRRIKGTPGVRETPIVMVTATEDREAMISGLAAGADDYVSKSADVSVLVARIEAQLRRHQLEDETRRVREELVRAELEVHEQRAARVLAEARAELLADLERKNRELEAFSYSVSHDLRAPLRAIDGFSQALAEDLGDRMDDGARDHLRRVRAAAQRMGELIDDLLELSRVVQAELVRGVVDVTALCRSVIGEVGRSPDRAVTWDVASGMYASADPRLLRIVYENLLGNAWKFTAKVPRPTIRVGVDPGGDPQRPDEPVFYVADDGAGFDPRFAGKLFAPFQRLHRVDEFAGSGIGLSIVARIVDRHGGRIWADGSPGAGAIFRFTLPERRPPRGAPPMAMT